MTLVLWILPSAPSLTLSSTSKSISATASSTGATKYRFRIGGGSWNEQTGGTYTFTGLASDTSYTIEAQASDGSDWSASTTKSIRTDPVAAPSLTLSSTSNSISARASSTGATKYRFRTSGGRWNEQSGSTYTFTGLASDTSYTIEAQASDGINWSASTTRTIRTDPPAVLRPPAPSLTLSAGQTSVGATASAERATKYRFSLDGGSWIEDSDGTYTFTGLSSSTAYTVEAQAGNVSGWSASTTKSIRTTAPPVAKPSAPTLTTVATPTTIEASGSASGATKYRFRIDNGSWNETTGSTHTFTGLASNTSFDIDAQAGNTSGWSPSASATVRTKVAVPPAPDVTTRANVTNVEVTASAARATKYRFRIANGSWNEQTGGTYTFTRLDEDTPYRIRVEAGNASGWSETTSVNVRTGTTPIAPGAPTLAVTPTDTTIKAVAASDNATKYRFRTVRGGVEGDWNEQTGGTYTFTGLPADTAYLIEAQAGNTFAWSGSTFRSTRTLQVATGAPSLMLTAGSAAIEAVASEPNATKYRFSLNGGTSWTEDADGTYTFTGLNPSTSYTVTAQAGNDRGWSASTTETISTLAPPADPPSQPTATVEVFSTAIDVIAYSSRDTTKFRLNLDGAPWIEDADGVYRFEDLEPETDYTLNIEAGSSAGWSDTYTLNITTLQDVPQPPTVETEVPPPPARSSICVTASSIGATKYRFRRDDGEWVEVPTGFYKFNDIIAFGESDRLRYPEYITEHQHHIMVGYSLGSLQFSPLGDPEEEWEVLTGAGEIGVGRPITGLVSGYQGLLFIFTSSSVFILRGGSQSAFTIDEVATDYGALPNTAQMLEQPVIFSADGIRAVSAQDAGTGIGAHTLSNAVQGLVDELHRLQELPTESFIVRGESQYRVCFPSGRVIVAAYVPRTTEQGEKLLWEISTLQLPQGIEHASSAVIPDLGGAERILFTFDGDLSGTVYQEGTTDTNEFPPEGFDGEPIRAFMRFARNDLGMLRGNKKFRTLAVAGKTARDLRLGVRVNAGTSTVRLKQKDPEGGAPARWGHKWGSVESEVSSDARIQSRDTAFALTVTVPAPGDSGLVPPHVLESVHIGFTQGREVK